MKWVCVNNRVSLLITKCMPLPEWLICKEPVRHGSVHTVLLWRSGCTVGPVVTLRQFNAGGHASHTSRWGIFSLCFALHAFALCLLWMWLKTCIFCCWESMILHYELDHTSSQQAGWYFDHQSPSMSVRTRVSVSVPECQCQYLSVSACVSVRILAKKDSRFSDVAQSKLVERRESAHHYTGANLQTSRTPSAINRHCRSSYQDATRRLRSSRARVSQWLQQSAHQWGKDVLGCSDRSWWCQNLFIFHLYIGLKIKLTCCTQSE